MDDWSSVDDRVSQMVGGVVGNCMVGNWVGNSVMGNWMGHCMVGNRVANSMGNRVSQEANTMVSWRMVDSWVGHGMVGSVVHHWSSMMHNRGSVVDHRGSVMHKWCSMMHNRGSVMHQRGSMMHNWSSMMHNRCSMMHNRCSMMHDRGSVMHHRGSMVNNWGSMVHNRSMMHNWSLIIDCLSSVSHFLDHPISTIVVSHSLHSSIGQGDGVRAGGGVAISGLLLLEVCPAVAVVDPVLVGVRRGLGQVLVGQLRSWGSQATADKGQQQDHLGGEGVGGATVGKGGKRELISWIKVRGRRAII